MSRASPATPLGSSALPLAILRLPPATPRHASFARVRRGACQADVLERGARCVLNINLNTCAGRVAVYRATPEYRVDRTVSAMVAIRMV